MQWQLPNLTNDYCLFVIGQTITKQLMTSASVILMSDSLKSIIMLHPQPPPPRSPPPHRSGEGHIAFGADSVGVGGRVGVRVASYRHSV